MDMKRSLLVLGALVALAACRRHTTTEREPPKNYSYHFHFNTTAAATLRFGSESLKIPASGERDHSISLPITAPLVAGQTFTLDYDTPCGPLHETMLAREYLSPAPLTADYENRERATHPWGIDVDLVAQDRDAVLNVQASHVYADLTNGAREARIGASRIGPGDNLVVGLECRKDLEITFSDGSTAPVPTIDADAPLATNLFVTDRKSTCFIDRTHVYGKAPYGPTSKLLSGQSAYRIGNEIDDFMKPSPTSVTTYGSRGWTARNELNEVACSDDHT